MQKILVVEDDLDIQELLKNFLQEAGYVLRCHLLFFLFQSAFYRTLLHQSLISTLKPLQSVI